MAAKVSKEEAHYRDGNDRERCGLCTMFIIPDGCTKVAGEVSTRGLCDYFVHISQRRTLARRN